MPVSSFVVTMNLQQSCLFVPVFTLIALNAFVNGSLLSNNMDELLSSTIHTSLHESSILTKGVLDEYVSSSCPHIQGSEVRLQNGSCATLVSSAFLSPSDLQKEMKLSSLDTVTFAEINTGAGATKVYPMNQALTTTDSVQFSGVKAEQVFSDFSKFYIPDTSEASGSWGWYRIASGVGRASGRFEVFYTRAGNHGQFVFEVSTHYCYRSKASVNVLSFGAYAGFGQGFFAIRLGCESTFEPQYVDILFNGVRPDVVYDMVVNIYLRNGRQFQLIRPVLVADDATPNPYVVPLVGPLAVNPSADAAYSRLFAVDFDGHVGVGRIPERTHRLSVAGAVRATEQGHFHGLFTPTVAAVADSRLVAASSQLNLPSVLRGIEELNPVSFHFNDSSRTQYGVLASDIRSYFPAAVATSPAVWPSPDGSFVEVNDVEHVDTHSLATLAIAGVKALAQTMGTGAVPLRGRQSLPDDSSPVSTLKTELASAKERIAMSEARIQRLEADLQQLVEERRSQLQQIQQSAEERRVLQDKLELLLRRFDLA